MERQICRYSRSTVKTGARTRRLEERSRRIRYAGFVINAVNNAKAPGAAAPTPKAAAKRTNVTSIGTSTPSRPEQRRADASCLRRFVPDIRCGWRDKRLLKDVQVRPVNKVPDFEFLQGLINLDGFIWSQHLWRSHASCDAPQRKHLTFAESVDQLLNRYQHYLIVSTYFARLRKHATRLGIRATVERAAGVVTWAELTVYRLILLFVGKFLN